MNIETWNRRHFLGAAGGTAEAHRARHRLAILERAEARIEGMT
jgi:hypothetical protein